MPQNAELTELARTVEQLARAVERLEMALPRNDLGQPDVDGHRAYHSAKIKQAKEVKTYQMAVTQKILMWGVGLALTMLGAGFWQTISDKLGVP